MFLSSPSEMVATVAVTAQDTTPLSAAEARERLVNGNNRFVAGRLTNPNQAPERRQEVAGGQAPFSTILACADSRVGPEILFDQGLGDLFVVRSAGNFADIYSVASIEYSVAALEVPLIVVLGHEYCGAVGAACDAHESGMQVDEAENDPLTELVEALLPSAQAAAEESGDFLDNAVRINARLAAADLLEKSEIIREAVDSGRVEVVPAYVDLNTGKVRFIE